ncbi:hypothetical protein AC578_10851 [Pseudocercospora eumusae]|uniref:Ecp2 effector protein-like domain-containing protein n=1 Tax=Pseudocercospora eumusae TaxID=321146 RepID=A0A139H8V6_9PEZI|nr:hypothetical protein AC578_10851 [Pseudocercospora eumusae]
MHFSGIAALIALLPALGSATCTRCKSNADPLAASLMQSNGNAGVSAGANDCGDSSFVKITQSNRPVVADCQQLVSNLAGDKQWVVTTDGIQVAVYGTCAFNAVSFGGNSIIGNADVIDLINDSIEKFQDNGYLGAKGSYNMYVASSGSVPCTSARSTDKQVRVDWTISHP